MDVSGNDVRLWINEREGRDGAKWNDYSVSISKKKDDGSDQFDNVYLKVRFAKSVQIPAGIQNGELMTFDGFMTIDKYTNRDGNEVKRPMVMITRADFGAKHPAPAQEEVDGFTAAEDDIPF